jgi:hypothetical protein
VDEEAQVDMVRGASEPEQPPADQRPRNRPPWGLLGCLVFLIALIVALLLFWLRGCETTPRPSATTTTAPTLPVTTSAPLEGSYLDMQNRVYAAIRPLSVGNLHPVVNGVYMIGVGQTDRGWVTVITLTSTVSELDREYLDTNLAYRVGGAIVNAVMGQVPDIVQVVVVDHAGQVVASAKR